MGAPQCRPALPEPAGVLREARGKIKALLQIV